MKILHTVENYHPSVGGAQEVVRQISERLAKLGHDVTVATTKLPDRKSKSHNGVKIMEFDIRGNPAIGYAGPDVKKYKNFLVRSNFDVMMNYAAQQWSTDLVFGVINQIKAKKVLVPCGFSGLYEPLFKKYFEKMPEFMKKYDATVYLSNNYRDINFARHHKINNTHFIPNGAGKDEFTNSIKFSIRECLGIPQDNFLILTVGSHTGLKGHAEATKIFDKAKVRNATLLIEAKDFGEGCAEDCARAERQSRYKLRHKLAHKQLLVENLSRKQTIAAYREADLFLLPSNIENSPLVLFEAMASRLPFLTTDVGNAKEIIKWSGGGLLLPTRKEKGGWGYSHADIDGSAQMVERLYNDPKLRKSLGESGYVAWQKRFTWEIISKQYEKLYKEVLVK